MKNVIIAVTGGIGSGKSTATEIIKKMGYTVFSADSVYAELLKEREFIIKIYNELGIDYSGDNEVEFEREKVAKIVFKDKTSLNKLNAITHPIIMQKMLEKSKMAGGVVFNEVPLLFESDYQKYYDGVFVITRSLQNRIKAVQNRDGLTEQEIILRIKNQFDYENSSLSAHTVIVNDGTIEDLAVNLRLAIEEFIKKI